MALPQTFIVRLDAGVAHQLLLGGEKERRCRPATTGLPVKHLLDSLDDTVNP
jgi:hypothetical protein